MSDMGGNPQYQSSVLETAPEWALVEAIRALAFEQRTANLIQYAVHNTNALAEGIDVDIRARLGLPPESR